MTARSWRTNGEKRERSSSATMIRGPSSTGVVRKNTLHENVDFSVISCCSGGLPSGATPSEFASGRLYQVATRDEVLTEVDRLVM